MHGYRTPRPALTLYPGSHHTKSPVGLSPGPPPRPCFDAALRSRRPCPHTRRTIIPPPRPRRKATILGLSSRGSPAPAYKR